MAHASDWSPPGTHLNIMIHDYGTLLHAWLCAPGTSTAGANETTTSMCSSDTNPFQSRHDSWSITTSLELTCKHILSSPHEHNTDTSKQKRRVLPKARTASESVGNAPPSHVRRSGYTSAQPLILRTVIERRVLPFVCRSLRHIRVNTA